MSPHRDENVDDAALDQLARAHGPAALALLARCLGPDAAAEALAKVFKRTRRRGGPGQDEDPETWLLAHACAVASRSEADPEALAGIQFSLKEAVAAGSAESSAAETSSLMTFLCQALATLPPEQRTAVVLRRIEGRPAEQAAEILGIDPDTLAAHLNGGMEALRQVIAKYR